MSDLNDVDQLIGAATAHVRRARQNHPNLSDEPWLVGLQLGLAVLHMLGKIVTELRISNMPKRRAPAGKDS